MYHLFVIKIIKNAFYEEKITKDVNYKADDFNSMYVCY